MANDAASLRLVELARDRFHQDIRPGEKKLFEAAATGQETDCTHEKDRNIRADRFSWLCANPEGSAQVTYRGLSIKGAEIEGDVDLSWAKITFPLQMKQCTFKGAINLRSSHLVSLDLSGSSIKTLDSSFANIEGNVTLSEHFQSDGGVNLLGAKIDAHLDCENGQFIGTDSAPALDLKFAQVQGTVFLQNGFKATGGVELFNARIEGNLDCRGGKFLSKASDKASGAQSALDASFSELKGNVVFQRTAGKVRGRVQRFIAIGQVSLAGAKIGKTLHCTGSAFISRDKTPALDAYRAEVMGDVIFAGLDLNGGVCPFRACGEVRLAHAKIEGNLDCSAAEFRSEVHAFNADSATIAGSAIFGKPFVCKGDVIFRNAHVGRDFQWCTANAPHNADAPGRPSCLLTRIYKHVPGTLEVTGQAEVAGKAKIPEGLDLRGARVGKLLNPKNSWPSPGKLQVDGFIYDEIDDSDNSDAASENFQLQWLRRQPRDTFLPQPYEQLARVLRDMRPTEDDWRNVLIAKNLDHFQYLCANIKGNWRRVDWYVALLWYGIIGRLIGYGYRPFRAFMWSLILVGIGAVIFKFGYDSKLITPPGEKAYVVEHETVKLTKRGTPEVSKDYPKFNGFAYSLESFVPVGKLGMGDKWEPNANLTRPLRIAGFLLTESGSGTWFRNYLWFHIICGWLFSALWVGAITGLAKT